MAHMTQELKKSLAPAIKAVLKKYGVKASLSVNHHSALAVNIKSSAIDFDLGDRENVLVGEAYIELNYMGVARTFLLELRDAMNVGNHNNSDCMTDYFDVGWYVDINIGNWGRPYIQVK